MLKKSKAQPRRVPTFEHLSAAAENMGILRDEARRRLKAGEIMIQNYEGRKEIAAGFGVEENSARHHLRTGKLKYHRVGQAILCPVGQYNEHLLPGWPDVPRKKYKGPRVGDDVIIPPSKRGPKPAA